MNSSVGIKTVAVFVLVLGSLIIGSCDNFMSGGDSFKEQIKQEVAEANAPSVSITVRAENDSMGTTSPLGSTNVKVGVPFNITTTVNSEFGFVNWIQEGGNPGDIVFADATSVETTATVKRNTSGLAIRAMFDQRPYVVGTSPFDNETNVVITRPIRITFSRPVNLSTVTSDTVSIRRRLNGSPSDPVSINEFFQEPTQSGSVVTLALKPGETLGTTTGRYEVFVTVLPAIQDIEGRTMPSSRSFRFVTTTEIPEGGPTIGEITVKRTDLQVISGPGNPDNAINSQEVVLDFDAFVEDFPDSPVRTVITDDLGNTLYNEIHVRDLGITLSDIDGIRQLTVIGYDESENASDETTINVTLDRVPPTLDSVSMGTGFFNIDNPSTTLTFTFSEEVTGFTSGSITAENGVISGLSGNGTVYTATFTADGDTESDENTISVAGSSYTDLAGNTGSSATSANYVIDTLAPTVDIELDRHSFSIAEPTATVTFTFTEEVSGFSLGDIDAENGAMSDLAGNGTVYTATFTASADTESDVNTISVAGSSYTDLAGNSGSSATSSNYVIDTLAPTVDIELDRYTFSIAEPTATVTFTFSEEVSGFTAGSITAENGTLSGFGGSGDSYTATFTANEVEAATNVITVSGGYQDAVGNTGVETQSENYVVDLVAPTVSIGLDRHTFSIAEPTATVTFTFSEEVTGFTSGSITAANGVISGLSGNGTVYTATFTADADIEETENTISVADSSYTDLAGNSGSSATSANYVIDTLAPTVSIGLDRYTFSIAEPTATVTFTFTEEVSGFSLGDIDAENGAMSDLAGNGTVYTATFTAAGDAESDVNTISVAGSSYTDLAGNSGSSATSANYVIDTLAPTFANTPAGTYNEGTLTVQMNSDASGFARIEYLVDAGAPGDAPTDWTAPEAITELGDSAPTLTAVIPSGGQLATGHHFWYRVIDGAGNTSDPKSVENAGGTISVSSIGTPSPTAPPTQAPPQNEQSGVFGWFRNTFGGGSTEASNTSGGSLNSSTGSSSSGGTQASSSETNQSATGNTTVTSQQSSRGSVTETTGRSSSATAYSGRASTAHIDPENETASGIANLSAPGSVQDIETHAAPDTELSSEAEERSQDIEDRMAMTSQTARRSRREGSSGADPNAGTNSATRAAGNTAPGVLPGQQNLRYQLLLIGLLSAVGIVSLAYGLVYKGLRRKDPKDW